MMYLTSDENFQYFCYNNHAYKTGTIVELDKKYIDKYYFDEKLMWKYAQFSHRIASNRTSKYFFWAHKAPPNDGSFKYICFFTIDEQDLEDAIKEIVNPIHIKLVQKVKKKDSESQEVMIGWIIYIFALMFSFIFKQWYIVWLCGSVYFFLWRKKKLWE